MVKTAIWLLVIALSVGTADAACSLNPRSENKCEPALMKLYKPLLARWQQDSKGEDTVLSSESWPEKPDCLPKRTSHLDCPYIGDVAVDLTELPQVQVLYRTYAVTISACSGVSGSSCHLYHRVYVLVDGLDSDGERKVWICATTPCP
jgi:hypothetical protein